MLHIFHVVRRVRDAGVMVAQHGHRHQGMGCDELGVDGRGTLGAGWGEQPRIEADRAGYECEASPSNTRAL
jgi:hypothetical protein